MALLVILRDAGGGLVAVLGGFLLAQSLLPAVSALALAALVGGFGGTPHATLARVWVPLLAFVTIMAIGHAIDAVVTPFAELAKARVNGAHRARVAALACGTATIEPLENQKIQDLVRLAAADPQNWTERTPGDGALAQLGLLLRFVGAISACGGVMLYAVWLVPLLGAVIVYSVLSEEDSHQGPPKTHLKG